MDFCKVFSFIFLVFTWNGTYANSVEKNNLPDSIFFEQQLDLARRLNRFDIDSSRQIIENVLAKSEEKGLELIHFKALMGLTENYEISGDYHKSDSILQVIGELEHVKKAPHFLIEYYLRLAHNLELRGLTDSSVAIANTCISISKETDSYKLASIYFRAAATSFNAGRYNEALKYYLASLDFLDKKDLKRRAQITGCIGMIYLNLGQVEESLYYYTQAYDLLTTQGKNHTDILYGMGKCYFFLEEYEKAYEYLKRAVENPDEKWTNRFVGANSYLHYWKCAVKLNRPNHYQIGMQFIEATKTKQSYSDMQAEILIYYKKLKQAELVLLNGLAEAKKPGNVKTAHVGLYSYLADVYEKQKNYELALHYFKLYSESSDSIRTRDIQNEIINLQAKYNAAERDAKISTLQNEVEKKKLEARLSRTKLRLSIIISFLMVLSFAVTVFVYRHRQQLKLLKLKAENAKKESAMEALIQQSKTHILQSNLEGQEKERNRLAKELHDDLGGRITALRYFISSKKELLDSKDEKMLKTELKEIQRYVRNISHKLAKPRFTSVSLPELINEQKFWVDNSDINLRFNFSPDITWNKIPEEHQNQMYRIVQEALTNALKHAKASTIEINIAENSGKLEIEICDDGIGIGSGLSNGIGIKNMQERAAVIHSELLIESQNNNGTAVRLIYAS